MALLIAGILAFLLTLVTWGNDTAFLVAAVSIALLVSGLGVSLARKPTLRQKIPLYLLCAATASISLASLRVDAAERADIAFARPQSIPLSMPDRALSLRELFETDFHALRKFAWHGNLVITDVQSRKTIVGLVLTNTYADFHTNQKFYAFFLPAAGSPQVSYRLSEALVDGNKLADMKLAEDTLAATDPAGTDLLAVNNLKFSQVIYVYHKDPFSPAQSARLTALFAGKGVRLFLRDDSYANQRSAEEHAARPHPI
jgi:hypothetical protein